MSDTPELISGFEPGEGRAILVIVPHADDAALQCGGTMALWSAAGWRVVLLRVTDDATDSAGLDRATTIERNRRELEDAAAIMGVADLIDLGYETDTLGDASERALRERFIRAIRTQRPYGLVTFDPFSGPGENNQDHLRVAQAADEAFWTAMFDKHHPEHLVDGVTPHGVYERWYVARRLVQVDAAVDISAVVDVKLAAVAAHRTMMHNMVAQVRLQAITGAVRSSITEVIAGDDPTPFAERLVRSRAARAGARHGVAFAEEFRRVRFSDLNAVFP